MKNPHNPGIHIGGYTDRLAKLIGERLEPGADKERIDQRIWDLFGAEWAVMFTDLAGFSRCAADFGIIHFLQIIAESKRILTPCIDAWDGILIKIEGDSMLLLFKTPRNAVECAIEMQRRCNEYNQGRLEQEKLLLCVGIGYGDVLNIGGEDVFGAEVNAAAKLGEDTAVAWEILVTESVADQVRTMSDIELTETEFVPHGAKAAFKLNYRL